MMHLSFKNADEDFQKELIKNIDPRIGGLSNNISEFWITKLSLPHANFRENLSRD